VAALAHRRGRGGGHALLALIGSAD
jgi:hypothetical protein